jgi:hypothetical protein
MEFLSKELHKILSTYLYQNIVLFPQYTASNISLDYTYLPPVLSGVFLEKNSENVITFSVL